MYAEVNVMAIDTIATSGIQPHDLIQIIESIDWTHWQTEGAKLLENFLNFVGTKLA